MTSSSPTFPSVADGQPRAGSAGVQKDAPQVGSPARLLFITNTGEFGGAERHLLDLVQRLAEPGIAVTILCLDKDLYSEHLGTVHGSQIEVIRVGNVPLSFWAWRRLFRSHPADVVIFVRAWLWCYRWHAPLAAKLAGIPACFSIAHLTPPPAEKLGGSLLGTAFGRGRQAGHRLQLWISTAFENRFICVSNAIRDALITDYGFPPERLVTIHNGVPLARYHPREAGPSELRAKLQLKPAQFILLSTARLSEQKRIDLLLLAIAQLQREDVDLRCVLVGDGPLRQDLIRQAEALGVTGRVIFEGFQPNTLPYLQGASAFVLCSDREGLPLSILEAMACGLPCIVTNVGGNAEAVTDRVQGLVIPPGSAPDLAAAISFFVQHPVELAEMSRKAVARARQEFDLEGRMAAIKSLLLDAVRIA